MDFSAWLKANSYDESALTGDMRRHLSAAWREETQPAPLARPVPDPEALERLRASRAIGPMNLTPRVRADVSDPEVMAAALALNAGVRADALAKTTRPEVIEAASSPRMRGFSYSGLLRSALHSAGLDAPAGRFSELSLRQALRATRDAEMMASGPSTISVPGILSNVANKSLLGAYATAPQSWRAFAAIKPVSDFKVATAYRPSIAVGLEAVAPGGEVTHGTAAEESYTFSVGTYARQLTIDRRDLINDDLSAFSEVLPAMGRGAARSLNDLVYTAILANAGSFWSAGNANYAEGAGTVLAAAGLSDAIKLIRAMKDGEGNLLDLAPVALLVPSDLETTAKALVASATLSRIATSDSVPEGNPFMNAASVIVEPRLSDSGFSGYSATAWYLFSAPSNAAVVVAFLDGMEAPTTQIFGFDSDIDRLAIGFRVFHDFGCALGDFRSAIRMKGSA